MIPPAELDSIIAATSAEEEIVESAWSEGRQPGELDGHGYCLECRTGPFGDGVYFCHACSWD